MDAMNSTNTDVSEPKATRRDLLRGTAAALVLPQIVPAAVLAGPDKTAPSDKIGIGVIGTGGRGTMLLRSFMTRKEARIVAVCDAFSDRMARAAKLAGKGCFQSGDFRKILVRDGVDAVVIAPQDHWHALIAVAAARAGKAIYCEKPLGVSLAESQAIRKAVRRYRCVFQTGTQQRSNRNFRFACELARNGYL
ncbi:MAG: Gfo/Idh/MocA family oxidoreductase, partial [Phycisphaerae bacterium]|nr:Gfo/Idh/MocA family oxidoreductase [Phycisphaerae bacterium]